MAEMTDHRATNRSPTGHDHPLWRRTSRPGTMDSPTNDDGVSPMKKLLLLVILGGIGYLVYRQYMASQAEQDLWAEATAAPDLR